MYVDSKSFSRNLSIVLSVKPFYKYGVNIVANDITAKKIWLGSQIDVKIYYSTNGREKTKKWLWNITKKSLPN